MPTVIVVYIPAKYVFEDMNLLRNLIYLPLVVFLVFLLQFDNKYAFIIFCISYCTIIDKLDKRFIL